MSQNALIQKVCAYAPWADEALLERAYLYALEKHACQKRESGEDYFTHPLEVASLLARMRMDPHTVVAGLLHDVLEDSDASYDELVTLFGEDIANIVEGVSKLADLGASREKKRVNNLKKLLLASSHDLRVLIVKLADRLHNVRTLSGLTSRVKRCRIAQETLEIYAPVAQHMGMHTFGEEMENLAFSHLHPIVFASLHKKIKKQRIQMRPFLDEVAHTIMDKITHAKLRARISRRWKTPYSVYQKMLHLYGRDTIQTTIHIPPDLVGFRILSNDAPSCYQILGLLHGQWSCVFQGFRDYISLPKKNGYQSLHSRIMIENTQVEFQIRTYKMNAVAQYGLAAHWRYKGRRGSPQQTQLQNAHAWLARVLDTLEADQSPEILLESASRHLFQDRIFCFGDDGRILTLPRGSTVVDFAYGCDEETGTFCSGALVNGKSVPVWFPLSSGDEIHIQKANTPQVSPAWEGFAPSGQARSGIQKSLKKYAQERARLLGEMIFETIVKLPKNRKDSSIDKLCHTQGYKELGEFYASIGSGRLSITKLGTDTKTQPSDILENTMLKGLLPDFSMRFVPKLFPLPGESIVGVVTKDLGIDIYPLQSSLLSNITVEPFQLIALAWNLSPENKNHTRFPAQLILLVHHKIGVFKTIATLIAQEGGNIDSIRTARDDPHFRQLRIGLDVFDLKHLQRIIEKLGKLNVVYRVRSVRGGTPNHERTRRFLYAQSGT